MSALETAWSIPEQLKSRFRPKKRFDRFAGLAAQRDGITVTGCGAFAGLLTPWSVELGCAGAGGIRTQSESGIRWTFGALRQLRETASSACLPR